MSSVIACVVPQRVGRQFLTIEALMHALPKSICLPVRLHGQKADIEFIDTIMTPSVHMIVEAFAQKINVRPLHGWVLFKKDGIVQRHKHAWMTVRNEPQCFIIDPSPIEAEDGPSLVIDGMPRQYVADDAFFRRTKEFDLQVQATLAQLCQGR